MQMIAGDDIPLIERLDRLDLILRHQTTTKGETQSPLESKLLTLLG